MTRSISWPRSERFEWLRQFTAAANDMDIQHVVPFMPGELIATARKASGFHEYGCNKWREAFEVLNKAINGRHSYIRSPC